MIALPTLAGLAARWALARTAVGRFINRNLAVAAAVAAAVVLVLVGLWWLRHDAASDAEARATSRFKIEAGKLNWRATYKQLMADRRAMAAADKARAEATMERDYTRMRVIELERQLQALGDDPVIYPHDLVRAMRK